MSDIARVINRLGSTAISDACPQFDAAAFSSIYLIIRSDITF